MAEKEKNNKVIEIELNYVETPKGNVATLDSVEQLANVILILDDEINAIKEKINKIPSLGGVDMPELEERLKRIESVLMDLDDKVSILVDAMQELAKGLSEIKKRT
ncbi:MAG TPA: hypothetical protein EYH45_05005 [Candidatus Caldiarchaeum subterraneum]|uniref:Uncharacterized protein n=1 Tax=Caldiarchaeum subterraneum TaxID=311458 RepID=A0A832ZW01_CALS0|nr:hypothetical protein [Candidatus Caldarchaeum subterraneum]